MQFDKRPNRHVTPCGCEWVHPILTPGSLGPHKSAPQTSSHWLRHFCMWSQHRHTDHAACEICSNRLHLRNAA